MKRAEHLIGPLCVYCRWREGRLA